MIDDGGGAAQLFQTRGRPVALAIEVDVRHLEHDALTDQFAERGGCATDAEIDQFREGVAYFVVEIPMRHWMFPGKGMSVNCVETDAAWTSR